MSENIITTDGEVTDLTIAGNAMPAQVTKEELAERYKKLEELDKINIEQGRSIVSSYWEARAGDEIRGIFLGWKVLEKKDQTEPEGVKKIPAIVVETKEGERLIAAMQVVESFYKKVAEGSAVYIRCDKSKTGEMKEFTIKVIGE